MPGQKIIWVSVGVISCFPLKLRPSLQQDPARKYGLTIAEVEDWRERFLHGDEHALRGRL